MACNIAVMADIHIRLLARHTEYQEIFINHLYPSLRENNVKLIFVVGDIVHSKLNLSPEEIILIDNFLSNLASISPTYIILGNHDVNMTNVDRMDAITPFIEYTNNPNLTLFKHSGIYTTQIDNYNLILGVYSLIDSADKWPQSTNIEQYKVADKENISVALYHGALSKSYTDITAKYNFNIFKDSFDVNKFGGWDQVWLGDIHRHQFLRNDKSAFYCGSLIQQDFGEDYKKGYVIVDLETKENRFVQLKHEYGYHTINIDGIIIPDGISDITKSPRLRIISNLPRITVADRESIRYQAYKRFNPIDVTISEAVNEIVDYTDQSRDYIKRDVLKYNTRDISILSNLLSDYLNKKNISKKDVEKVLEINKSIFSQLSVEPIKRGINWKLKKLSFKGLFSYRNLNVINFSSLKGLTGLFGGNRSGKSSIIDILLFALFNTVSRRLRNKSIVNRKTKKGWVKIEFDIDNTSYVIERNIEVSGDDRETEGSLGNVDFYSIEDGEKCSLNGGTKWETDKNIRMLIGDCNDLMITAVSPQDKLFSFIDAEPRERKEMMATFLDIVVFEELYKIADEECNEIERYLKSAKKKNISKEINAIEETIVEAESNLKKSKQQKKDLSREIYKINKKIKQLSSEHTPYVKSINIKEITQSIEQASSTIKNKEMEIESLLNNIRNTEKMVSSLKLLYTEDKHDTLKDRLDKYKQLIDIKHSLESSHSVLNNSISKLKKSIGFKIPSECTFDNCEFKQSVDSTQTELLETTNKFDEINEKINKLNSILESIGSVEDDLDEFNKALSQIKNYETQVVNDEEKIASLKESIKLLNDKIGLLVKEKEEYYLNQEIIEKNNELDKAIGERQPTLNTLNRDLNETERNIISYHSEKSVLSSNLKLLKETVIKIQEMDEQYKTYKLYLDAMHRDGIAHDIIETALPKINSEINRILSNVVDFEIRFDVYKDSKKINIWLLDKENGRRHLEGCSGMEKTISSIAIRTALANLSSLPKPDILIIDEGFGTLDPENINNIGKMLLALLEYFSKIVIVTHVDVLRDVSQNIVEVRIENGCSTVNVG